MLIVDGTDPELVRNIWKQNCHFGRKAFRWSKNFESMAAYAPAFGMIGTLIGLINMLRTIDDPALLDLICL